VLRVNLDGTFHCLQAFARLLIAEGATGAAVNVSSAAGLAGFPARSAYGASKHGVIGLTKAAAMELAPHGIRVNAIAPGFIYTPMTAHYEDDPGMVAFIEGTTPMGRRGRAEEIADAVVYAASPGASFMTGSVLTVDGGLLAGVSGKAGPATSVS
jgi:meso-butanediol dehydrogenase/(S,S)-butanediol dehydrogenase/diacetyl reductase